MNKLLCAALLSAMSVGTASAAPLSVVAAENFYGDVAQQIGGAEVTVRSILSNPDQDPHLFEASPSVARAISAARIVVYNGVDYDPWMAKLLRSAGGGQRKVIVVADLIGRKSGDNPHIWYDPATLLAFARALADDLGEIDPAHRADYERRFARFGSAMEPIEAKIRGLHDRLAGTPVTATEPVFGYMLQALGLEVRNEKFQLAVMNNTEPGAAEIAAFEKDLKTHQVKLLVYNSQASDPAAERMLRLAKAARVPVVGVTETEPPGKTYEAWMLSELDAVDQALAN